MANSKKVIHVRLRPEVAELLDIYTEALAEQIGHALTKNEVIEGLITQRILDRLGTLCARAEQDAVTQEVLPHVTHLLKLATPAEYGLLQKLGTTALTTLAASAAQRTESKSTSRRKVRKPRRRIAQRDLYGALSTIATRLRDGALPIQ